MKIALDYDDTYTRDPEFWDCFIKLVYDSGHVVKIVTARDGTYDNIDKKFSWLGDVIYTGGVAKKWWCHHYANYDPDIWVDDSPEGITNNSTKSKEWLDEWRATREG